MAQRKLSKQETQQALPLIKEFNKLSKAFIGLLSQKVDQKRQRVHTLSVMVTGMKIPVNTHSTINIRTVDMNRTAFYRKNKDALGMRWEDDFKSKRRGIIL